MARVVIRVSPQRLEAALLPGAGLVLAFATLSVGATPPWARATMELAILALLAVWLLAGAFQGEWSFRLPSLLLPMLAIFLFAGLQAFGGLSVYPPATRQEVWELLAVGGFFFLLHNQLTTAERMDRFITGLLIFAGAVAVFGVLQALSFTGKLYWIWEVPQRGTPFGPFINRNHYAAWALMVIPLAWMKFSSRHRQREVQVFWGLVLFVLGISILLSQSRAGAALFVLCFPLYWVWGRKRHGRQRWMLATALVVILAAGLVTLALDTGTMIARWQTLGELLIRPEEVDRYRLQIWRDTGAMIRDHLWVGTGLETFGVLSDSYRSFYSNFEWQQVHNDYLQWVAETGLVGAALTLWFLVVLVRTAMEKLQLAAGGPTRRVVVAALTGCLLVLLHSLVDFPLRIPANALLFFTLLALITAPATGTLLSSGDRPDTEPLGHAEFRFV